MSRSEEQTPHESGGEELARLLARRNKPRRARSTSALIVVLLILVGVLIGVPLGRATAPSAPAPVVLDEGSGG